MSVSCNPNSAVCLSDLTKDIWQTSDGLPVTGKGDLTTPGGIISAAWPYLFAIAGLILFAMLMWGALEIQFGAADAKSAESGKKRITQAVIGFILLFSTFWMGQIIQQIFGLNFAVGQEVNLPAPDTGGETEEPSEPSGPMLVTYGTQKDVSGNIQICAASSSPDFRSTPAQAESVLYRESVEVSRSTQTFSRGNWTGGPLTRCATVTNQVAAVEVIRSDLYQHFPREEVNKITWQFQYIDRGIAGHIVITPILSEVSSEVASEMVRYILEMPDYEFWNQVSIGEFRTNVIIALSVALG